MLERAIIDFQVLTDGVKHLGDGLIDVCFLVYDRHPIGQHGLRVYCLRRHVTPLYTFANRADLDQAALVLLFSVCLWKYDISDPTHVDLTSNFFVL